MFYQEFLREVSLDPYCLSFSSMIYPNIFNLQFPLSLQMTPSVYVRLDLLMTLRNYKQISTMPLSGVLHQNYFLIIPNSFIFASGPKTH